MGVAAVNIATWFSFSLLGDGAPWPARVGEGTVRMHHWGQLIVGSHRPFNALHLHFRLMSICEVLLKYIEKWSWNPNLLKWRCELSLQSEWVYAMSNPWKCSWWRKYLQWKECQLPCHLLLSIKGLWLTLCDMLVESQPGVLDRNNLPSGSKLPYVSTANYGLLSPRLSHRQ